MENAAVQRLARVLKNEKKLAEFGGTGSNFVGESGDLEEHSGADSDIFGIESNSVSGYEEDESILTSVRPPTCKRDQDGRGDRKGSAELDFEEAALGQVRQGQHSGRCATHVPPNCGTSKSRDFYKKMTNNENKTNGQRAKLSCLLFRVVFDR